MKIEICANALESAIAAQNAGADRVELCSALGLGGLTPSYGTIKRTVAYLDIPVHVLIRPRSGNFTYTESEIVLMLEDIKLCKDLGCKGIVSGVLHADNRIDEVQTRRLRQAASGMEFTFHRAFDWCPDPYIALNTLKRIQITRLLSSGQQTNASKGIALLRELKLLAENQMEIMPGCGINEKNITAFEQAGFISVHLSATEAIWSTNERPKISMHSLRHLDEQKIYQSSQIKISKVLQLLR